jgi:L-fucose isomerase-like protein
MAEQEKQPQTVQKAGILFLGRKRPGFDPEWGAEVRGRIKQLIQESELEWVAPSDNIADETELREAIASCRNQGAQVLVVTQPTVSDGRLAPVLGQVWGGPLVMWATPEKQEGSMISANSLVGTHAFSATLRHLGAQFELLYGHPDEERTRNDLWDAMRIAFAADRLQHSTVGLVGSHAPGFIDFHADPASISNELGVQIYYESVNEFLWRVEGAASDEVETDIAKMRQMELPTRGIDDADLPEALHHQARYHTAMQTMMAEKHLDGLAFRDWPDLPSIVGHWPYFALARMVSGHQALAMEGDVDGAICSIIAESLGIGPVYLSDWLEHDSDTITIWHTGAAPFQLCEPAGTEKGPHLSTQFNNRKPTVVEATLKAGLDVTLFRLWRCDGQYAMTAIEGSTVEPRRHLMATNGLFHTDEVDVREWFDEMVHAGMPHHVCIVPGHRKELLRRFARLMGLAWHG